MLRVSFVMSAWQQRIGQHRGGQRGNIGINSTRTSHAGCEHWARSQGRSCFLDRSECMRPRRERRPECLHTCSTSPWTKKSAADAASLHGVKERSSRSGPASPRRHAAWGSAGPRSFITSNTAGSWTAGVIRKCAEPAASNHTSNRAREIAAFTRTCCWGTSFREFEKTASNGPLVKMADVSCKFEQ